MSKERARLILALFIIVGGTFWFALRPAIVGPRLDDIVDESSGVVASQRFPGVLWTHNDSGGDAALYAVREDGTLVATVALAGARNVDWEALTLDSAGNLWIGDVGNNANRRRDLTLYVVPEPRPRDATVTVAQAIAIHYPEQVAFPPDTRNFDAEALFADGETIYLLTKHRADTSTVLYRLPPADPDDPDASRPMIRVAEFDVRGDPENHGGMVTDAALSPDGQRLAILTYHSVFLFARPEAPDQWFETLVREIPIDMNRWRQCEAITWRGGDLLVTNEDGQIFTLTAPLDGP